MKSSRPLPRLLTVAAALALTTGLIVTAADGRSNREGGVFRIAASINSIDPALTLDAGSELGATCAKLMNNPDKPGPAGAQIIPEVAAGYPRVSRDGKTYTFTIRSGFRFSTGEPVTAQSFAHAVNRVLNPAMNSPWVQSLQDIVGANAVIQGKATGASGVEVRRNELIVRLTRPASDFPARTTEYAFCAVPVDLPITPEGVGAPLPGAGPYYIAEFVAGQKLVLKRNPLYRGSRPHHVDEFDVNSVDAAAGVSNVEAGIDDWVDVGPFDLTGLDPKYRSQLHAVPGTSIRYIALNTSQPLFKDNALLRQAVNFAIDRPGLLRERGGAITGRLTDQYLPPFVPGFADARIYPLYHPDPRMAKALARGHARTGRAMLYIKDTPIDIAQAQIVQRDLKPIGITVHVKKFPGPVLFQKLFTPGTPYDMTFLGFGPDYWDPYAMLNELFDGQLIGSPYSFNTSYFDSPKYNALLGAASRLKGAARYRAYGKLDVDLARNEAPIAAYASETALTFVSKRVGCLVLNPYLDLAAVCLK